MGDGRRLHGSWSIFLLLDKQHERHGGGLKALGRRGLLQGGEEGAPVQEVSKDEKQD